MGQITISGTWVDRQTGIVTGCIPCIALANADPESYSKVAAIRFQHVYVSKISTEFQSQTPPSHNIKHRIWSDRLEGKSPLFGAI